MPSKNVARLCIVGGYQRSGTRNFADLCNAHPEISLFGEVGLRAFPPIRKRLKELAAYHEATRQSGAVNFAKRKHLIALSLLAMHANKPRIGFSELDFKKGLVGFKTPRIEWEWQQLSKMFDTLSEPKVFFYCCRTPEEVYLSTATLGWTKNVSGFARDLKLSLQKVLEFQAWSKKSSRQWLVRPLHLNAYIQSTDKARWLADNLFCYVAPETGLEEIAQFISETDNRNSTLRAIGQERRTTLTPEERAEFESDRELEELLDQLNSTFDLNVRLLAPVPDNAALSS